MSFVLEYALDMLAILSCSPCPWCFWLCRFSAVKRKPASRGRGQNDSDEEEDANIYGSKKNQQLVARLQARAEKRAQVGRGGGGVRVGLNRRGRKGPLAPNMASIERARRIAAARKSKVGTSGVIQNQGQVRGSGSRGRGLLRGLNRANAGRGAGAAASRNPGGSVQRGRGGTARGGITRGRGRGGMASRGSGRGGNTSAGTGPLRLRRSGQLQSRGRGGGSARGAGRGGVRGAGRGRGRGRGRGASNPPTREQLDQEMDTYMAKSKINVISFD